MADYVPRKIKRKWVEIVEVKGPGSYDLKRGERVIDSKVIGEMVSLPRGGTSAQYAMPEYKTILVLECVEFEDKQDE